MNSISISNAVDFVLILCIFAVFIATVRMCALDAVRRGKSPWLVSLLVIAFFPVGLLAWLLFRPKTIKPDKSQTKSDLDDFRAQ